MADVDNTDSTARVAGDKTSVQIYIADRDRLQAKQREITYKRNVYIPMFDLIHELVERAAADLEGA